ncbi:amidase family protein [Aeromicrobium wangtongii]|uniref:amidase family protein n=1 Tax=Aeromicrobium wangtongii TaxID=2969247 RepID=UPI0020180536|nr:amidase family protein [Aeromicrobium wangtongii]MCL3817801.1 amidase family protein [Aeromicrobium wangtongii]
MIPVVDRRTWRVVGNPLVRPTSHGGLDGESVAVKDLFAVAGHRIGAGNPAWLEQAAPEAQHATVVARLLEAGASVLGIAGTDEFAYSLAGTNAHHGSPPNLRAPGRIPGGSSSGSASAVATGQATIGLGTDTGGSIRVPAAYQGLWGIRTTHGAVPTGGLLPLAPAFDTVGWLTRGASLLARVGDVLLPPDSASPGELVTSPALTALADPVVAEALGSIAATGIEWPLAPMPDWLAAMQALQAWQAWQVHGPWLTGRLDTLGPDVRARFERAASLGPEVAEAAREEVARARETIEGLLGDGVLLLPSASSVAPPLGDLRALDAVRQATMQLTCLAGITGRPAVSVPLATPDGLPVGACLVGPAGSDRALIDLAATLEQN